MQIGNHILSQADRTELVASLDFCLSLFGKKDGLLNAAEIRAKSLLSLVRNEVVREINEENRTGAPFNIPSNDGLQSKVKEMRAKFGES